MNVVGSLTNSFCLSFVNCNICINFLFFEEETVSTGYIFIHFNIRISIFIYVYVFSRHFYPKQCRKEEQNQFVKESRIRK